MDETTAQVPHIGKRGLTMLAPLVALLASAAALAQPAGPGADMPPHGPRHAMHMRGGPGAPGAAEGLMPGLVPERALDAVGATAEQKAKLRDIAKAAHADVRKGHDEGRKLHEELHAVLSAPTVDAAAAEGVRQKLQAHREAISKRMLQAQLDGAAVLSAGQRQKLAEMGQQRREMHERHRREREALAPTPRS